MRARRRFEQFTGHKATKSRKARLDASDVAGYALGEMVGVAYEATRDGKTDQYFHRFKKRSRPVLVSRSDGKQLYIAGGDYEVTDHGIEDRTTGKTMPELFIVNPSRRRKAKASAPKRRKASTRRKATPKKVTYMANPVRRRRRRRSTARATYRRNPIAMRPNRMKRRRAVTRARYRRNPARVSRAAGKGSIAIMPMILPSLMIGAGAVGAELVMGYLPLPAMFKTGAMRHITKAVVSVAGGWAIAKYANKKAGEAFAAGGIAISAHDMIKEGLTRVMPGLQFGGYNWDKYGYNMPSMNSYASPSLGYYSPGATYEPSMGEYMDQGMGEYMDFAA